MRLKGMNSDGLFAGESDPGPIWQNGANRYRNQKSTGPDKGDSECKLKGCAIIVFLLAT